MLYLKWGQKSLLTSSAVHTYIHKQVQSYTKGLKLTTEQ